MTLESLPHELVERDQWVCWRFDDRPTGVSKIPVDPTSGGSANVSDPTTWGTFAAARARYEAQSDVDGVGFVFTEEDPFVGIDLDDCVDGDGQFTPLAAELLERTSSYAESSPSRRGLHVVVSGRWDANRNRGEGLEVYDSARYFTVTGERIGGGGERVEREQELLDWLADSYLGGVSPDEQARGLGQVELVSPLGTASQLGDDELLERARNAANGQKFRNLFHHGSIGGYPSQSEADAALCEILLFWSRGDRVQTDRLFRRSALSRDKWDRAHDAEGNTYGELTIEKVLRRMSEFYDPAYYQ